MRKTGERRQKVCERKKEKKISEGKRTGGGD